MKMVFYNVYGVITRLQFRVDGQINEDGGGTCVEQYHSVRLACGLCTRVNVAKSEEGPSVAEKGANYNTL